MRFGKTKKGIEFFSLLSPERERVNFFVLFFNEFSIFFLLACFAPLTLNPRSLASHASIAHRHGQPTRKSNFCLGDPLSLALTDRRAGGRADFRLRSGMAELADRWTHHTAAHPLSLCLSPLSLSLQSRLCPWPRPHSGLASLCSRSSISHLSSQTPSIHASLTPASSPYQSQSIIS